MSPALPVVLAVLCGVALLLVAWLFAAALWWPTQLARVDAAAGGWRLALLVGATLASGVFAWVGAYALLWWLPANGGELPARWLVSGLLGCGGALGVPAALIRLSNLTAR